MFAIVSCLQQYDLGLLALSVIICIVAVAASLSAYQRAVSHRGGLRTLWICGAAALLASGVWATHFMEILAHQQALRLSVGADLTALSFATALGALGAGMGVAATSPGLLGRCAGGAICGLAIPIMHFLGITALGAPGAIQWDFGLVAVAIAISLCASSAAFGVAGARRGLRRGVATGALLVTAIAGLHFTAMAAATILPGAAPTTTGHYGREELAIGVGVLTTLILIAGALMLALDRFIEMTSVNQLQAALRHAPSALAYFDRTERLMFWNQAYAHLLDAYGVEAVRGLPFKKVIAGVEAKNMPTAEFGEVPAPSDEMTLAKGATAGGPVSVDMPLPNGRWVQSGVEPTDDGGFVVMLTDVTERRELTLREAEARELAEAANRAKSEFLANMSHEIRTPLNAVLGMAQIMARNPLEDEQRHRLDIIGDAGQALLHILDNVLDLSKIEAGKVEFEAHPFDIEDLMESMSVAYAPLALQKDVGFSLDLDPEARGLWRGDSGKLRQVLSNLLSNALKFTAEGAIRMRVRCAEGGLAFEIADSGVGIPADKIELIFDKFTQADASTTRRFGGTGLGLAICRHLVELMGGSLQVTSSPKVGSTFAFALPLTRAQTKPAAAALPVTEAETRCEALRILAAEDNPTNQLILNALLEPLGADVTLVETGIEAVQAFQTGAFDLILMDIQMPEMNGSEATVAIRAWEAAHGAARIPIIALTANVMQHQLTEYVEAGMDDCVAKPISATVLIAAIERALEPQEGGGLDDDEGGAARADLGLSFAREKASARA